ncbi:MAG: sulfotransferase [Planctomycetales bacterium]
MEQYRFASHVKEIDIPPPVFVLGHWRSGTTHLHNLLTVDQRFAFPNNYQALFPHTFLTTETLHSRFIELFLPKRRPMDNVEWTMQSPQEDEFALCITTFKSPCMGWIFPERRDHFDRYLTFRDVTQPEIDQWKAGLVSFLKRLTWKLKRPLVLKSPPHTCRIKLLREIFPQARFVHIHRDPYAVFLSMRQMLILNFGLHGLQQPPLRDLDEFILRQYRKMYEVFFEELNLIPTGHFHEVCFEDLVRDPFAQMEQLYESLNLPNFAQTRSELRNYVDSLEGYRKNQFPKLNSELQARIAQEWGFCFDHWGYPIEPSVA